MALLELVHVKKYFSSQKAVDDVSFALESGSIFGLLGPNGAGKTTLLRMITGILLPDEGDILFNGEKFHPEKHTEKIGYMPEERGLYKKMKIGEQAIYLTRLRGTPKDVAIKNVKDWFVRLNMQSWWDKKVEDLSKGMSQKLQFVITVAHNPSLIILDEPFSGLDPVNAEVIKEEIFRLAKQGSTIIFSTHRMEQVEEICDHIILMSKGQKILDGTVKSAKQQYKENLYQLELNNAELLPESELQAMHIVSRNGNEITVKKESGTSSNALLQQVINTGAEVVSFNEKLPSLNDIFIKLVEGTSTARQFQKEINQ